MPMVPALARSRSAGVRAQATHAAEVASATVSNAVTRPPDPRRRVPRGPGSNGARLLATMGDQGASTRLVYRRMEPSLVVDNFSDSRRKYYIIAIINVGSGSPALREQGVEGHGGDRVLG